MRGVMYDNVWGPNRQSNIFQIQTTLFSLLADAVRRLGSLYRSLPVCEQFQIKCLDTSFPWYSLTEQFIIIISVSCVLFIVLYCSYFNQPNRYVHSADRWARLGTQASHYSQRKIS